MRIVFRSIPIDVLFVDDAHAVDDSSQNADSIRALDQPEDHTESRPWKFLPVAFLAVLDPPVLMG